MTIRIFVRGHFTPDLLFNLIQVQPVREKLQIEQDSQDILGPTKPQIK